MPFKSRAQQRFMYANRKALEAKGVDVSEWAKETDFKKLPEKVAYELPKLAALTARTELRHGDDAQQPLLLNPYLPSDPDRATVYENGYEHAMGLGHLGLQQYDVQAAVDAPVPWREGFADATRKMGRGDIADTVLASIAPPEGDEKSAAVLTPEGLLSLAGAPDVHGAAPGVLFDIDGTLVPAGAYRGAPEDQQLRPGVLETLLNLASTGLRMVAVTNRSVYDASTDLGTVVRMNADVLDKSGGTLRDVYFMAHGPTEFHKPSGAMLRFAMQRERIDPSQCLYVGDSEDDANAAADAGIPFIHADEFFTGVA